jgi:hypothetical protein
MALTTNHQPVKQNATYKASDLGLILGISPDRVIVQSRLLCLTCNYLIREHKARTRLC